jgi:1-aminocyclopropane-1-carboxylate deaminase/D-cysteine desulfhydrase-like pyridoxal-dependent ACC family enzyme
VAISNFERYPLTFGPSPLQRLDRLTAHLGGAQIWAKREDLSSGLAFGGNKVRKLEYIVPDILASGADTLVSIGGYQSNHTRQVAAVAAHLGLKAVLCFIFYEQPGPLATLGRPPGCMLPAPPSRHALPIVSDAASPLPSPTPPPTEAA